MSGRAKALQGAARTVAATATGHTDSTLRIFHLPGRQIRVRLYGGDAETLARECEPDGSFIVQAVRMNASGPAFIVGSIGLRPAPDPWWGEAWNFFCHERGIDRNAELRGDDVMGLFASPEFWNRYLYFGRVLWTARLLVDGNLTWAELDTDESQRTFVFSPQMMHLRSQLEPKGIGCKRVRGRPRHRKLRDSVLQLVSYVEMVRLQDPSLNLVEACALVVRRHPTLVPKTWNVDNAAETLKRSHARSGINLLRP